MDDLFDAAIRPGPAASDAGPRRALEHEPILVFDIAIQGDRETSWQDLFQGFRCLKAITFSASVPAILDVAALFDDVEITFGSERVLSRELAVLEQVTNATGYRFTDALADQKAFIERFVRPVHSERGARLLERVQDGSPRFRLLRETPSHAKLYLLAGDQRFRAIAGSANLSLAAFSGRQRETFFVADGEADYRRFLDYYAENEARSDPIDADLLVVASEDHDAPSLDVPTDPVSIDDVPCFHFLKAQGLLGELWSMKKVEGGWDNPRRAHVGGHEQEDLRLRPELRRAGDPGTAPLATGRRGRARIHVRFSPAHPEEATV